MVLSRPRELGFYVYVDNVGVMGTSKEGVDRALAGANASLVEAGLRTHEVTPASLRAEVLGVRVDGESGVVRCSAKRFWKLDHAISWILGRRSVRGDQLEVILGHCTYVSLLSRGGLSVLDSCYKFVRSHYHTAGKLWASARAELVCF